MTKQETLVFIRKIKAYYPIFKLEEEGIDEWALKLKPYDLEDVVRKFEEHLKGDRAEEPPKLHFLTRYLRTKDEKETQGEYTIECNLCHKWMTPEEYDIHYEKCLDIQYLENVAKQKGEKFSRKDLENCKEEVIDKLLKKYPPEEVKNDYTDVFKRE